MGPSGHLEKERVWRRQQGGWTGWGLGEGAKTRAWKTERMAGEGNGAPRGWREGHPDGRSSGERREPRKLAGGGQGASSVRPPKERHLPFLLRKQDGSHLVRPCLPMDALVHPVGSRSPLQRQTQTRRDVSDLGGCQWGGGTEGLGLLGHILPSWQPHWSLGHLLATWGAGRAEGLWRDGGLRSCQSIPSPG